MKRMKPLFFSTAYQVCCGLAVALALTACTDDIDDHYESATSVGGTLWNAISSNPELSYFARVAQACGYDRILNGDQTFTVFAPVNTTFTAAEADELISSYNQQSTSGVRSNDNTVVRRFVQNHIALYRHTVSSLTDCTIKMINDKYATLTDSHLNGNAF